LITALGPAGLLDVAEVDVDRLDRVLVSVVSVVVVVTGGV
jgi:hypothetical protein